MLGMIRWSSALAVAACLAVAAVSGAVAGEVVAGDAREGAAPAAVPAPVPNALLLLSNIGAAPAAQQRQAAFDESIKRPGPAPRPPSGEVQPDGTVRYGPVTMSVKNPCPPGEHLDEPRPLPGRRARK